MKALRKVAMLHQDDLIQTTKELSHVTNTVCASARTPLRHPWKALGPRLEGTKELRGATHALKRNDEIDLRLNTWR